MMLKRNGGGLLGRILQLSVLSGLIACEKRPLPMHLPGAGTPGPASPALAQAQIGERPPASAQKWAQVYHRDCSDSITAPVLAPDGLSVASCGSRFALDHGRFLGAAPFGLLALLAGDRALVDEYLDGGLTVLGPDGDAVRDKGGRPSAVAVSRDGIRVVSLELMKEERVLIVRELPSLKRVRYSALGKGPHDGEVGFLADGREVFFGSYPCTETECTGKRDRTCRQIRCADTGLFVVSEGALKPLVTGLRIAALAAGGDQAAIVRTDGSAALVRIPDGHPLAALPRQQDRAEISAMAVSPSGDRVALAGDDRLSVYAVNPAGVSEVLASRRHFSRVLRFTPDGRTLLAGDDLGVYREGAAPRPVPSLRYDVKLPQGFVPLSKTNEGWSSADASSAFGGSESTTAMYYQLRLGASVEVSAIDPSELGADGDVDAWAQRALLRYGAGHKDAEALKRAGGGFLAWRTSEGRAFELHWIEHGCDVVDNYERISEKGGAVYRVRLRIPGELSARRVIPWLIAFFDTPLGPSPARSKGSPLGPAPERARPPSASRSPASKRM